MIDFFKCKECQKNLFDGKPQIAKLENCHLNFTCIECYGIDKFSVLVEKARRDNGVYDFK